MSLALLTRGYICPPAGALEDVELGPGPTIVQAEELKPDIDHGRELTPRIDQGDEVDD